MAIKLVAIKKFPPTTHEVVKSVVHFRRRPQPQIVHFWQRMIIDAFLTAFSLRIILGFMHKVVC